MGSTDVDNLYRFISPKNVNTMYVIESTSKMTLYLKKTITRDTDYENVYATVLIFGSVILFERSLLCSPRLHLFDWKKVT